MINAIIFFIRSFGTFLGDVLEISVPLSDQAEITVFDFVLFFFILYMFVKLFQTVTKGDK